MKDFNKLYEVRDKLDEITNIDSFCEFCGTVIDVSWPQPSKAPYSILPTLDGIDIDVNFKQEEKALSPMDVTLDGIDIDINLLQFEKV